MKKTSCAATRESLSDDAERVRSGDNASAIPRQLHIIHFNDVYNIEARDQDPVGGAAKFVSKCRELRERHNALVLFAGDAFNPSIMSTVTRGEQMPPVLNNIGVAVSAVGNHDLDFGLERMKDLMGRCNFPWLMANVLNKATHEPIEPCKRYHVVEHSGVRVGVLGVVEYEWLATLATLEVDDVHYIDFVDEARRLARLLRDEEGVDVVIALTHMRVPNDMLLGAEVPEIDLVLGGHDHHYEVTQCAPNGTLLFKSGTDFRDLSLIKLELTGGVKPTVTHERYKITSEVPDDEETAALVRTYTKQVGESMDEPIGRTAVPLDGRFHIVRTQESNLGNFVADAMRYGLNVDSKVPVDFTILNAGSLRSDMVHETGTLRRKDLLEMLPMMDELVLVSIRGDRVLAALNNGVSAYPKLEGRFLQVSGLTFTFDASRAPGDRVLRNSVTVNGKPLDLDREYVMGTKAYLLHGKDGFESLREVLVDFLHSQCKVLRSEEDCPHLPSIISHMFESMGRLNAVAQAGEQICVTVDCAGRRLLAKAAEAQGNDSSAIIRFFPDENEYMIDPAMERRIQCVNDSAAL